MSPHCQCFSTYHPIAPHAILAADKGIFYAIGMGNLQVEVPNGNKPTPITLTDTLHAPDMGLTVISVSHIAKAGYSICFKDKGCKIKNQNSDIIGNIPVNECRLYKVKHAYLATTIPKKVDILTLHRCLGHISMDAIRALIHTHAVQGLQLIDDMLRTSPMRNRCMLMQQDQRTEFEFEQMAARSDDR